MKNGGAMADVLFLGVGHPDRGDDSIGPRMAARLKDDEGFRGVEVLDHHGEGAALMELWAGRRKVVIVDAMKSGAAPGSIRRFDAAQDKLPSGLFRYSSHVFGLAEAVEMSRALNRLPPAFVIYGVEGRDFGFGAPLSWSVAGGVSRLEALVKEECRQVDIHKNPRVQDR